MKQLLLTGFEPFLDFSTNPTYQIVNDLDGKEIHGFQIIGNILSVDFKKSGKQMLSILDKYYPDAVISLGLAAGRDCVNLERIAINCNDGPVDNSGFKPDGEVIFPDGQDGYFSTLPIKHIVSELQKEGFPAKISNTAGAYLCNNVMYHALYYFHRHGRMIPSGFIHLPASHKLAIEKNMPSWSEDDLQHAVWVSIRSLVSYLD